MTDVLRPTAEAALSAWAQRVRANREQVEQFREVTQVDFYAPIAGMFRADPRRRDEPALEVLRTLIRPTDTVLDVGAGGGRLAMPLALIAHEVIAVDPSEGMLQVLREGMAAHAIDNVHVVQGRWPAVAASLGVAGPSASVPLAASGMAIADVVLISHLGYDVEDIGPFLDALEAAARRVCVAVLLDQPPPTPADLLWPDVHGVARAALPSLPEFLALLLARGNLFELQLVERPPQTYDTPAQALAWLRGQLWTTPDGPKDVLLQKLVQSKLHATQGRYALAHESTHMGIVTWRPGQS